MDPGSLICVIIAGFAVGSFLSLVLERRRSRKQAARLLALSTSCARLEAELAGEKRAGVEREAAFSKAEEKFRETFSALSLDALRKNNQSFLDLAKVSFEKYQQGAKDDLGQRQKSISELVKPLRESLIKVESRIRDTEKNRSEAYGAIGKQIESMVGTQQQLQGETARLVNALRTPNVRGCWGEIQLRRVVELAGMLNYCDFNEQVNLSDGDARLRPDLVVHLPGGKDVVVDAKAPLAAYLEAIEAENDELRQEKLKQHSRQVREQINSLTRKAYWDQFDTAPEFVIMFLPGEAFFSAALEQDPTLIEYGVEKKVIPASPTTLIALLRAVYYGWQQEKIAANAQEINNLGKELYDRLSSVAKHLNVLGSSLEKSLGSYNQAIGSLESRVLVSARKFKELGVTGNSILPQLKSIDSGLRKLQAEEMLEQESEEVKIESGNARNGTIDKERNVG